jgi:hypothetical protein
MWRKYKRRVLLAMSSQAFAQLVGLFIVYQDVANILYLERNKWYALLVPPSFRVLISEC